MKKIMKLLMLVFVIGLLNACQNTKVTKEQGINTSIPIFVLAKYVKDNIDNNEVIFLDARGDAKLETLKGAVTVNWKELADIKGKQGDANWGVMLDKDAVSKILSVKGIDQNKEIVIFAGTTGAWGEDGRLFWQLKSLGYNKLKIVDGGYGVLKGEKLPMQNKTSVLKKVDVVIDKVDLSSSINTKELEKLITKKGKIKIIDTRTKEEYDGAKNFDEAKGGRLPGSINIDFQTLLDANGFLKTDKEITKIMSDNGITKDNEIITYCTAGIRSAYVQVVLSNLGYNVKNYDESFYRWSAINEVE